jgi:hypothetical protein
MLPTKKRERTYDYRKFSGLIYGRPKIGKSTFAAGLDSGNVLFLDTEDGTKHLDVFPCEIKTWNDAIQAARELLTTEHNFSLVVVDTIASLHRMATEHVLQELKVPSINSPRFYSMGRGHQLVNGHLIRLWSMLFAGNFGVYFIDHEKTVEKTPDGRLIQIQEDYKGPRILSVLPQTGGKAGQHLKGLCDLVLRATIDANGDRVLQTVNTAEVEAGDRSGVLPPVLPLEPSAFIECFRKAHNKRAKGGDS